VKLSFAASSVLARQIEAGGKADVFISADQKWMDYLQQRGLIEKASRRNLAGNRLVLIAPADSKVALEIAPGLSAARGAGRRPPVHRRSGHRAGRALRARGAGLARRVGRRSRTGWCGPKTCAAP
jgi:molybdate transport system substrate-binding protein